MKSRLHPVVLIWYPLRIDIRTATTLVLTLGLIFQVSASPDKRHALFYSSINYEATLTAEGSNHSNMEASESKLNISLEDLNVNGTVTDEDGLPLPGVNIVEKGTTNGTATDFDGQYTLTVSSESAVLVFSFLGFSEQEVPIHGKSVIDVVMSEGAAALDEIVVTALGIKKEQKALGYAVSSIETETITEFANPNAVGSIYGKAAGVQIKSNPGGPMSGVNVVIRGNNSITGFNQPLFVVDGIPIDHGDSDYSRWGGSDGGNGASDLNPEDIESISVLKGANASALYGSKAANGVVLITTKTGNGGQGGIGIDVSSSFTLDQVAYLPDYQNEFGSGTNSEVFRTNSDGEDVYAETWRSFGPRMEGQILRWWDGELRPYSPQPNNIEDIYNTGHTISNSVAIANSTENFRYRLSYTNVDFRGVFPGVKQKRNVYSLNTRADLTDKLAVELAGNFYDYTTTNRARRLNGIIAYQWPRSTKLDLVEANYKQDGYFNGEISGDEAPSIVRNFMQELWEANENSYVDDKGRLVGNITLHYEILSGLRARARIGTDLSNVDITNSLASRDPVDDGEYDVQQRKTQLDYSELMLTYNKDINESFNLSLTAGGVITREKTRWERVRTDGFINPNWFSVMNSLRTRRSEAEREEERTDALFGVAALSYRSMLYLEVTGRNDWSSTLPSNNNSYFYPSVSLSYVFSESLNGLPWLNFGKVRASWAETGNDAARYEANKSYIYDNYNSVPTNRFEEAVPPLNLIPESQIAVEAGVELKMFNNRLGVDITYYKNQNKDQIIDLGIAESTGATSLRTNVGQMDNQGIEIQLYGTVLQTSNFAWNSTFNFARNSSEVVALAAGINQFPLTSQICNCIRNEARVGRPYGEWTAFVYARDENGNRLVNPSGFYIRDDSERKPIGNSTPDFIGGMLNEFSYKNLSLNVNFDYSIGGDIFSFTNYYGINAGKTVESLRYRSEKYGGLPYYIDENNDKIQLPSHDSPSPNGEVVYHDGLILEGVTLEGAPNDKLISAVQFYNNTYFWNFGFHEEGLFDNSYIKMREIALRYSFNKDLIQGIGIQRASISLIGRNLFYVYKNVPHIDAESFLGTSSGEASAFESGLPGATRSYGVQLRLSF